MMEGFIKNNKAWLLLCVSILLVGLALFIHAKYTEFIWLHNSQPKQIDTLWLTEIAQDKADELYSTNYFSHDNIDKTGIICNYECRVNGYKSKYIWIGENLYKGVCDMHNVYKMWNESPEHKAILDHPYDKQSIVIKYYNNTDCYVVLESSVIRL